MATRIPNPFTDYILDTIPQHKNKYKSGGGNREADSSFVAGTTGGIDTSNMDIDALIAGGDRLNKNNIPMPKNTQGNSHTNIDTGRGSYTYGNQNPQSDNPYKQASQDPMANVQPWLDYGVTRGNELFSDLGRFNQNEKYGQGQDDVMAALQNRMQGTGDPQFNLMRERALEGQQRGLAQNLQLGAQQSGRSGVRGAGAMGLQQQALNQNSMDRRGLERDLALEQSDRQQQAEGNLAAYLQDLTQQQFQQDQYNNQQLEKERMGKFASEMGFGGMGMLDQGQRRGLEAANTIANMPQPQMPVDKGFMDRQYGGGWMDTFITPMGFSR